MSNAMWDAREALIPGGAYDRASGFNGMLLYLWLMFLNLTNLELMLLNHPSEINGYRCRPLLTPLLAFTGIRTLLPLIKEGYCKTLTYRPWNPEIEPSNEHLFIDTSVNEN